MLHQSIRLGESKMARPFFAVTDAGAYRLEAWLKLDGELRPWIFANPVYVRASH